MAEPAYMPGQQQAPVQSAPEQQTPFPNIDQLYAWAQSPNMVPDIEERKLKKLASTLLQEVSDDETSMADWEQGVDAAMKLAKQTREIKNSPWKNASNVKLPMVQDAVLQFAAKTYGKLLGGTEWVKGEHPGMRHPDEQVQQQVHARADRVSKYIEYQLRHEIEGWEEEFDLKLHMLPWVGCLHKKTYYDPAKGHSCSELVLPNQMIIHQNTVNIESARVTHKRQWTQNEYYELVMSGAYSEIKYPDHDTPEGEESRPETDGMTSCYEVCAWYDLDDDGYKEPYTVTIHNASQSVVRLVARFDPDDVMFMQDGRITKIVADCLYTKYPFIPAPDGSYWAIGWGHMAGPMNEVGNTLVNQLIDAGTLSNSNPGVVDKSVRVVGGGKLKFEPGKWPRVQSTNGRLADAFYPMPIKGPDPVLFEMLGMFDMWTKRLATTPETIAEETPANAPVGTTLAKIEQAERVANAIDKRIYRSWSDELKKLFVLNHRYVDPMEYAKVLNLPMASEQNPEGMQPEQVAQMVQADFAIDDLDLLPTANPETSSRTMRLAQADFVRSTAFEAAQMQQTNGDIDANAILLEVWDAAGVENPERFFKKPTPEEIEAAEIAKDVQEAMQTLTVEEQAQKVELIAAQVIETRAKAETEGKEPEKVAAETTKLKADAKAAAKPNTPKT